MLTERVPDVFVENVEAGIPSGSALGIDVSCPYCSSVQVPSVHAAWWEGFLPSGVRQVSLALQWVQETILSAETVP